MPFSCPRKGLRQKVSKIFFDTVRQFLRWAKKKTSEIVKEHQTYFSANCARHLFSGPFWEALNLSVVSPHLPVSKKFSGKKKAHKLLTHQLFDKAVKHGTTSRSTRRQCLYLGFGGEHIIFFFPVNRPVVPGQPDPHQSKKFTFMGLSLFLNHRVLQGPHPRGRQLCLTFPVLQTLYESVKSTLSHLKSCNPVGGTPSSAA